MHPLLPKPACAVFPEAASPASEKGFPGKPHQEPVLAFPHAFIGCWLLGVLPAPFRPSWEQSAMFAKRMRCFRNRVEAVPWGGPRFFCVSCIPLLATLSPPTHSMVGRDVPRSKPPGGLCPQVGPWLAGCAGSVTVLLTAESCR